MRAAGHRCYRHKGTWEPALTLSCLLWASAGSLGLRIDSCSLMESHKPHSRADPHPAVDGPHEFNDMFGRCFCFVLFCLSYDPLFVPPFISRLPTLFLWALCVQMCVSVSLRVSCTFSVALWFCLFVLSLFYLILIYYYYHYYFRCLFASCILKKRKKSVVGKVGRGWERENNS